MEQVPGGKIFIFGVLASSTLLNYSSHNCNISLCAFVVFYSDPQDNAKEFV